LDEPRLQESLDQLRRRALDGDARAEARLFTELRVRFLTIAKRRVQPDHAEDIVHEALGIVLAKNQDLGRDRSILLWGLTVLRNVIGNHYQARRREIAQTVQVDDWRTIPEAAIAADPVDLLGTAESAARLEAALAELTRSAPRCGAIFACILESLERGGGAREISQRALAAVQRLYPDLTHNAFYVTLHRCRARLRSLLDESEVANG